MTQPTETTIQLPYPPDTPSAYIKLPLNYLKGIDALILGNNTPIELNGDQLHILLMPLLSMLETLQTLIDQNDT